MTNANGLPQAALSETEIMESRLALVNGPDRVFRKDVARVTTNLASCFRQFLEIQEELGRQFGDLEDALDRQKQHVGSSLSDIPEMKQKINWLIASLYDQSKRDEEMRQRIGRLESELGSVADSVRSLCESQASWQSSVDQLVEVLMRARSHSATGSAQPDEKSLKTA